MNPYKTNGINNDPNIVLTRKWQRISQHGTKKTYNMIT